MKIPDTLETTATTTATTNIQSNESVHSRAVAPGVINIATTNSSTGNSTSVQEIYGGQGTRLANLTLEQKLLDELSQRLPRHDRF